LVGAGLRAATFYEAVSKVLVLGISCYDAWVAGTLYVPVPQAREVYSLARLSSNKDKGRICRPINLLSLRDFDVEPAPYLSQSNYKMI